MVHAQLEAAGSVGGGGAEDALNPHRDGLEGGEARALLADVETDALGVPVLTPTKIQLQPSSTVWTRMPSVPHMTFGASVMIVPS